MGKGIRIAKTISKKKKRPMPSYFKTEVTITDIFKILELFFLIDINKTNNLKRLTNMVNQMTKMKI